MAWKDKATIEAVAQYLRLLTGLVLFALLIWMFADNRIDFDTLLKVLLGTLTMDRFGQALASKRS